MLHQVQKLLEYTVHSSDGAIGTVCDILVDDKDWHARYLAIKPLDPAVPNSANVQNDEDQSKILVAMGRVQRIDADAREIHVEATRHELQSDYADERFAGTGEQRAEDARNGLDEALEETFPASDPPSTY